MIRRPPRSTQSRSSAASDVYKRQVLFEVAAGGALASAVVPLLALPLARSMRKDVDRTASAMLGWALAVLVPLAVVVAVLARPLVGVFMPGATVAELGVAASFLAMFAVQIPLYGAGLVLTGVLQAHRRFLAAALAPLLNSIVVIAVFLLFGQMVPGAKDDPAAVQAAAVALLGWGTTAGVAVMSLPLLWPVHRIGVRLRPTLLLYVMTPPDAHHAAVELAGRRGIHVMSRADFSGGSQLTLRRSPGRGSDGSRCPRARLVGSGRSRRACLLYTSDAADD